MVVVFVGYWRGRINDEQIVNIALETATTLIECGFGGISGQPLVRLAPYGISLGQCCYLRMEQGLTGAPGTYSRPRTLPWGVFMNLTESRDNVSQYGQ